MSMQAMLTFVDNLAALMQGGFFIPYEGNQKNGVIYAAADIRQLLFLVISSQRRAPENGYLQNTFLLYTRIAAGKSIILPKTAS
ncbi:hypothetical protein [Bacillus massiliglaciei]|uniref:hypothetical protein n=1 Tax=Bacillus massiliglaciei TaxID=1816693 RepID=UPI0018FED1A1|nr:hypothetical protein [Bacillus massiliglaciei]